MSIPLTLLEGLITVQDAIPEPPVEEPLWWGRGAAILLWAILLVVLIAFIVWVLRNPPGTPRDKSGG